MSKEIYTLKITVSVRPNPFIHPEDKGRIKNDILKQIDEQLMDMSIKAVIDSSSKEQKDFFRSKIDKGENPIKIGTARAVSQGIEVNCNCVEKEYVVDVIVEVP